MAAIPTPSASVRLPTEDKGAFPKARPGLPDRIGKYNLVSCLGKGAMGVVYEAFDPFLERDVALKVMLPQIADDPEQKIRFEREARAVAKLMHPNVVTVFDLGYHSDGSPYIAMELLKGQDLQLTLKSGQPLSFERKVLIILQVLEGVGHAHQAGIVHRDIKPANTFLSHDGTVKIMDFGVARLTAASMTATGIVVGTANYMSPEQASGAKVDGRSDLFSVACMLYELILERPPFQSDGLMGTLWKIVHEEPELEHRRGAEYAALVPILKRALAKAVDDRYQTASLFADALRDVVRPQASAVSSASASGIEGVSAASTPSRERETLKLRQAGLRALPAPAAARSAADPTPLFRLMREIQVGAKSGHLHFTHGQERRSLRIAQGQIVHATSDVEGQHLGDILVRYGLMSQADLERATGIVLRERRRLGAVLGELGSVGPERLHEAVGIHIREVLYEVAGRGDGSYVFEELGPEAAETGPGFAIGEMILETARRIQAPEVARRLLGDQDRVLSLSTQPLLRSQKLPLTPTDGFLLSRIDGTLSAREVFGLIPLPLEDVERSLFGLLCTGIAEYVSSTQRRAASRGSERTSVPGRVTVRHTSLPREGPQPSAARRAQEREAAERAAAERRALETRQASEARRRELVAAYEELASKDHFELLGVGRDCSAEQLQEAYVSRVKPFHPDARHDPALADLKDKRQAVYDRLREAYATLRDRGRRAKYISGLDARLLHKQIQPPAPPPPPQVVSWQVEAPSEAESILLAIREAQQLLKDEKTWDAIRKLEPLIRKAEGQLRFRAQVLLARAYLKNPKWLKRAEELLHRVVREAPDHAEGYVVLGNVYRASRLPTRALAMYRKALRLQPADSEAAEGWAALAPQSEVAGPGTGLKKLFRTDR